MSVVKFTYNAGIVADKDLGNGLISSGNDVYFFTQDPITFKTQLFAYELVLGLKGWPQISGYSILSEDETTQFFSTIPSFINGGGGYLISLFEYPVNPVNVTPSPEYAFQVLMLLYQANQKYGLTISKVALFDSSTSNTLNWFIRTENQMVREYDEFEIRNTLRVVPLEWSLGQSTLDTLKNVVAPLLPLGTLRDYILNGDLSFGYAEGGDIGVDSAIFNPLFASFYKGSTKMGTPFNATVFDDGHAKDWDLKGPGENDIQIAIFNKIEEDIQNMDITIPLAPWKGVVANQAYLDQLIPVVKTLLDLYYNPSMDSDSYYKDRLQIIDAYAQLLSVYGSDRNILEDATILYFTKNGKLINTPLYFENYSGIANYSKSHIQVQNAAFILLELIFRIGKGRTVVIDSSLVDISKNMTTSPRPKYDLEVADLYEVAFQDDKLNIDKLRDMIQVATYNFDQRMGNVEDEFDGTDIDVPSMISNPYVIFTVPKYLSKAELDAQELAINNIDLNVTFQPAYDAYKKKLYDEAAAQKIIPQSMLDIFYGGTYTSIADTNTAFKPILDAIDAVNAKEIANYQELVQLIADSTTNNFDTRIQAMQTEFAGNVIILNVVNGIRNPYKIIPLWENTIDPKQKATDAEKQSMINAINKITNLDDLIKVKVYSEYVTDKYNQLLPEVNGLKDNALSVKLETFKKTQFASKVAIDKEYDDIENYMDGVKTKMGSAQKDATLQALKKGVQSEVYNRMPFPPHIEGAVIDSAELDAASNVLSTKASYDVSDPLKKYAHAVADENLKIYANQSEPQEVRTRALNDARFAMILVRPGGK